MTTPSPGRAHHRLRSLPISRWAPLAGRIVADVVKPAWAIALILGVGMILGFRVGTGPLEVVGAFGLLLAFALAATWMSVLVGMLVSAPEKVQIFPITFRQQRVRADGDDAGLAAGLGHGEPGVHARRRRPGSAQRRRGGHAGGAVAASGGRLAGGLRSPLSVRAFKRRL